MSQVKMRTFLLFVVLSASRLLAAGAWPLDFFTSDPKAAIEAATKVAVPDGLDLFAIDAQFNYRVDSDARIARTTRLVLRVVTDRGARELGQYSQAWLAWRQDKPLLKARVITADGQAHLLDPSTITESGLPNQVEGLFTDTKVLAAPLPAVAKGALVEIEVQLNDREPMGASGAAGESPVQLSAAHLRATINVPANSTIHVATPGLHGIQRKDSQEGDRLKISLEGSDLDWRGLSFAPVDSVARPAIIFSTVADWNHVARWYFDTSEPQIGVRQPAPVDSVARMKEIEAILAEIQKSVRYTGIEFGLSAYIPHTPQQTLTRGFGDCKDKAALLINRLRAAGIAANLALLNPYPSNDVASDVPGVQLFSHAIVYIPGAHPLFVDPTSEFAPARRLPTVDQGRLALIVDPATTGLVRTPSSKPGENGSTQTFTLRLSEEGKASLSLDLESFGSGEEYTRALGAQWLSLPESRRDEATKQSGQATGVEKVLAYDWGNPKDVNGNYRMTVRSEGYKNSGGTEQSVYAHVPQMLQQWPQFLQLISEIQKEENATKKRTEDYDMVLGSVASEQWRVVPPSGFRVRNLPDVKDLTIGPLTVHRTVAQDLDGSVLFSYRMDLKPRITVSEAKEIREAIKQTPLTGGTVLVEFMPEGTMLMSEGKWKEGFDLLRRDASATPIRPGPGLRYAVALMEAGLRDEAARICRNVIEADPKSARAYGYLSLVERYDPIGRLERQGMDLPEAEKAIQKAVELDPGNKRYIADRALLKELDSTGSRYDDPQRLTEAIGLLEGISVDLPGIQQPNILPYALFRARRFADVKLFYEKPEGRSARTDLKYAAIAAGDGGAQAIRESKSLNESARKATLQGAARDLISIGEYRKAADLIEATGDPAQAPSVDLLRHTSRHGEPVISKDPVIAVMQRYIFSLLDQLARPKHDELLAAEWRVLSWNSERSAMVSLLGAYRNVAGFTPGTRATADIVVGNVEIVKEGSDALGYRLRFADPASNGALKTIGWVVRRGDQYQVLGLRGDEPPVSEALALANKGDLEGARKWLDWQKEEIAVSQTADPLATSPFLRLWPAPSDPPEKEQIQIAAASLMARGRKAGDAVALLLELRSKAQTNPQREAIDQAIRDGYAAQLKYQEQIPLAEALYKAHPSSANAIAMLGTGLINAGDIDGALKMAASAKPADDTGIANVARVKARAHLARYEFAEAIEAYRALCSSNKGTPTDWNNLAWISIFVPGKIAPDLKSAETAVRLTQERTIGFIHTLSSIQVEMGKLKEARAGLVRYLGTGDTINDSAWYLEGRIAEDLGLKETAAAIYSTIAKPSRPGGDSAYDLAQIRMKVMQAASK
jgi:tetratricopeptide (TPR) repeat protein